MRSSRWTLMFGLKFLRQEPVLPEVPLSCHRSGPGPRSLGDDETPPELRESVGVRAAAGVAWGLPAMEFFTSPEAPIMLRPTRAVPLVVLSALLTGVAPARPRTPPTRDVEDQGY